MRTPDSTASKGPGDARTAATAWGPRFRAAASSAFGGVIGFLAKHVGPVARHLQRPDAVEKSEQRAGREYGNVRNIATSNGSRTSLAMIMTVVAGRAACRTPSLVE
jgi:hypothetical protein